MAEPLRLISIPDSVSGMPRPRLLQEPALSEVEGTGTRDSVLGKKIKTLERLGHPPGWLFVMTYLDHPIGGYGIHPIYTCLEGT